MSDDVDRMMNHTDGQKAIRRLMDDLKLYGLSCGDLAEAVEEPIDLMVDQAIHGVDIQKRFPTFYEKLLKNECLRQQFIDSLMSFASSEKYSDSFITPSALDLGFLDNRIHQLADWPVFLTQPRSQLMKIFFSPNTGYRSSEDFGSEPVFVLLQKKFIVAETTFSVQLESRLPDSQAENVNTLAPALSLLIEDNPQKTIFPIQVSLRWGEYTAEASFTGEGKQNLPNISLSTVLDENFSDIKSDIYLTICPTTE